MVYRGLAIAAARPQHDAAVLKIAPGTMASFEAAVARQQASAFVGWWREHGLPPADLEALWTYAGERAGELDIEDDGNRGISLYAAAFALLGELSAPEFIEVSDLLFDPAVDARRLARIRTLADARRARH